MIFEVAAFTSEPMIASLQPSSSAKISSFSTFASKGRHHFAVMAVQLKAQGPRPSIRRDLRFRLSYSSTAEPKTTHQTSICLSVLDLFWPAGLAT